MSDAPPPASVRPSASGIRRGRSLHSCAHFTVNHHGAYVLVERSAQLFDTLADVVRTHRELNAALAEVRRDALGLIFDLRSARGRNDPSFETTLAPERKRSWTGWRRAAVLVKSVTGGLQVRRHMAEDGVRGEVFQDLEGAVAYVTS